MLRYQPCSKNPADYFSHTPVLTADDKTSHESRVADESVNFVLHHMVPKSMTLHEMKTATRADPTLQAVMNAVHLNQWHPSQDYSGDGSAFQILKAVRDELSISDEHNVLLHGTQVIIPVTPAASHRYHP